MQSFSSMSSTSVASPMPFSTGEAGDRAVHVDDAAEAVLARLDEVGELLARGHVLLEAAEQLGLLRSRRRNASPSSLMTSDLIAARTVAVRRPPSISAISPT